MQHSTYYSSTVCYITDVIGVCRLRCTTRIYLLYMSDVQLLLLCNMDNIYSEKSIFYDKVCVAKTEQVLEVFHVSR